MIGTVSIEVLKDRF